MSEFPIDKIKVKALLRRYCETSGKILIDDQGRVSCNSIEFKKRICQNDLLSMLPVRFKRIDGDFTAMWGRMQTLEGSPEHVGTDFACTDNAINSLAHGPQFVGGDYFCVNCNLSNFIGIGHVSGKIHAELNPFTSLRGLPMDFAGTVSITYGSRMALLSIMLTQCKKLAIQNSNRNSDNTTKMVEAIINGYLGKGRDGIIPCAAELHKAGFGGNARL